MTYKEASNKAKEDKTEILLIFCNRAEDFDIQNRKDFYYII